jgi:hypothetical protein
VSAHHRVVHPTTAGAGNKTSGRRDARRTARRHARLLLHRFNRFCPARGFTRPPPPHQVFYQTLYYYRFTPRLSQGPCSSAAPLLFSRWSMRPAAAHLDEGPASVAPLREPLRCAQVSRLPMQPFDRRQIRRPRAKRSHDEIPPTPPTTRRLRFNDSTHETPPQPLNRARERSTPTAGTPKRVTVCSSTTNDRSSISTTCENVGAADRGSAHTSLEIMPA